MKWEVQIWIKFLWMTILSTTEGLKMEDLPEWVAVPPKVERIAGRVFPMIQGRPLILPCEHSASSQEWRPNTVAIITVQRKAPTSSTPPK